ncbi:MAG: ankyrin repeat domain-containing protein [Aquabacterium sp.]
MRADRTRAARIVACVLGLLLGAWCGSAAAQVPPDAQTVAGYRGAHAAAHHGDRTALQALAALESAERRRRLEARDAHGRTPLHVATFARQRAAIQALADAGADLGALENDRYDAVTIAAVADDEPTLALLLKLGASAKLTTSRYDGTALIAAAHLGHDGVVRQLIAAGAPLDHVNNLHWTALIEAIVLGPGGPRHQACVKALLGAGASTALTDRNGRTPLQLARERGYDAMVRMLLAAGAK